MNEICDIIILENEKEKKIMGMDAYLFAAHSKKELMSSDFWSNASLDIENDWTHIGEKWYARKWYDMLHFLEAECFKEPYECGEYILMEKENIEKMLQYAIHHTDYFDSFQTVEKLCNILYHWDELQEAGLQIYWECDW